MRYVHIPKPTSFLLLLLTAAVAVPLSATTAMWIMVVATPMFLLAIRRSGRWTAPAMTIVCFAYLIGYATPVLFPGFYPANMIDVLPATADHASTWAVRGYFAMLWGYLIASRAVSRRPLRHLQTEVGQRRAMEYAVFVLRIVGALALAAWLVKTARYGISLTFIAGSDAGGSGTVVQVLSTLSQLRYAFFLGYLLLPVAWRRVRFLRLIGIGLLLVSGVDIVTIGSKASVIDLLVVVVLYSSFSRRFSARRQLAFAAGAVVTVLLTFTVITQYRHLMNESKYAGGQVSSFDVQQSVFSQALSQSLSDQGVAPPIRSTESMGMLERFGSAASSLAYCFEFTGWQSPYRDWFGNVLIPIYAVVPRAILPSKPVFFNSADFAREYFGWQYGGISISLIGSFYFAWGYGGILLGMLSVGLLLGAFIGSIGRCGVLKPHALVYLMVVVLLILDVGAEFQPIFINLERVAILMVLIRVAWRLMPARRSAGGDALAIHVQGAGNGS